MILNCLIQWDLMCNIFIRACYLCKIIDHFVINDDDRKFKQRFAKYKLFNREWEIYELLVIILLSFKKINIILQNISHLAIDEIFWIYEILFNKIDMLKATFSLEKYRDKIWVHILYIAINEMIAKLRKYYIQINKSFIYPNNVILESRDKLILFKQEIFDAYYMKIYNNAYREYYIIYYELII